TVLRNIGGQNFSIAVAINASGDSVGYSLTATGDEAVLWSPSGPATNLGAMLGQPWSDTEAVGINNLGDIFGFGDYQGKIQGFLLTPATVATVSAIPGSATPVPEASTWAMLVVGFAGLGFAAYRGKQNNRCI